MFQNIAIVVCLITTLCCYVSVEASPPTKVKPHYRKSGKYISPHERTAPDNNRYNNYGTNGNVNPNTGELGKRNPVKK